MLVQRGIASLELLQCGLEGVEDQNDFTNYDDNG